MRWIPLLLFACARDPYAPLEPVQSRVEIKDIPNPQPRRYDLLIVLDDSPAMAPFVDNLIADAPKFANVLSSSDGGLPDLRIAAITADPADGGAFRSIDGVPWLEAERYPDGSHSLNVPGTLGDAFTQLFSAGASGGAIAEPIDMARAALLREPSFLRDDAQLVVLFVGAQDDHSPSQIADDVAWFKAARSDVFIAAIGGFGCAAIEDLSDVLAFTAGFAEPIIYDACMNERIDPTSCAASDRGDTDVTVPVCAGSSRFPCFELVVDRGNCGLPPTQLNVVVKRRKWAPKGTRTHVECDVID